jgi:hypothetical protein
MINMLIFYLFLYSKLSNSIQILLGKLCEFQTPYCFVSYWIYGDLRGINFKVIYDTFRLSEV